MRHRKDWGVSSQPTNYESSINNKTASSKHKKRESSNFQKFHNNHSYLPVQLVGFTVPSNCYSVLYTYPSQRFHTLR